MDPTPWIESVALHLEEDGLPRIAGRIVGLLMICDPPHRSAAELVRELGASKGSVSAMTRLLHDAGTLRKVAVPGERATYFALAPDSLERKLAQRVGRMDGMRAIAAQGLALLGDAPSERRERLRRVEAMYAFMQREVAALLERWAQERQRLDLP